MVRQSEKQRINAMTNTMGLEKKQEDILAFEVSDETLEIAAGTAKEKANFTLGACTGLSVCPG
jgi:hypothetical protein